MSHSTPTDRSRPYAPQRDHSLPAGYAIRRATPADSAIIARHRRAMFEDIGSTQNLDLVERAFADWLPSRLDTTYFHWLAEHAGRPFGSAGVLLLDWPPSPRDPRGGLGFIYNVYVEPAHRRRGVARDAGGAPRLGARARARRPRPPRQRGRPAPLRNVRL